MHDGITLEIAGCPTAVIVTTEFVHEAEVQRAALGMTDLIPVVIDHPLSTITEEELSERAESAVKQAVEKLTGA